MSHQKRERRRQRQQNRDDPGNEHEVWRPPFNDGAQPSTRAHQDPVKVLRGKPEVVADMIAPDSLAGVYVFFPDPWPKKRHHKRRLLQPAFVHALAGRLAPGGCFHAATDWEDYAHEMLVAFAAEPLLRNTAQGFAPRPATRPLTKFEARGQRLGHAVFDLLFRRA